MDQPKRAVLIMEEDAMVPAHSKPLMLEDVMFCPILTWMGGRLRADGVQRFFIVCGPRFAKEAEACFPEEADVTVSERQEDLADFLNTPDTVSVLLRPALPMEEAGPGFAYAASGYELQEAWKSGLNNRVDAAELLSGWVPVFSLETVAELEMQLRDRIAKRHIQSGVRIMDPSAVYIDPRVSIGRGTVVLPGSILRGETAVGRNCVIGPGAVLRDYTWRRRSTPPRSMRASSAAAPTWGRSPISARAAPLGTTSRWATLWSLRTPPSATGRRSLI